MKKVALITLIVLILDQVVKLYVKSTMTIGQDGFDIWFFKAHFVENNGMAFGQEFNFAYGKLILGVLRIIAITAIFIGIRKLISSKAPTGLLIAVGCVFAGAIGNVIDGAFYGMMFSESTYFEVAQFMPPEGGYSSFMHGKVVDMLQFDVSLPEWSPFLSGKQIFPFIFNIADAAISIGIFTILIWHRDYFRKEKQLPLAPETEVDSSEEE